MASLFQGLAWFWSGLGPVVIMGFLLWLGTLLMVFVKCWALFWCMGRS